MVDIFEGKRRGISEQVLGELTESSGRGRDVVDEIARRGRRPEFAALKSLTPDWQVVPLPDTIFTVVATKTNEVIDLDLPNNAQVVKFEAPSGQSFWIGFGGRVIFPVVSGVGDRRYDPVASPTRDYYFVRGKNSLSIGLANINDAVSVLVWTQV